MCNEEELRDFLMKKIEAIMQEHGWENPNQMAAGLEISYTTLNSFITGEKSKVPLLYTIFRICKKIGMPLAYFFKEDGMILLPEKDLPEYDSRVREEDVEEYAYIIDRLFSASKAKRQLVRQLLEMDDKS